MRPLRGDEALFLLLVAGLLGMVIAAVAEALLTFPAVSRLVDRLVARLRR